MTIIIDKELFGRGFVEDKDSPLFELKEPIGYWIYKTLRKKIGEIWKHHVDMVIFFKII